MKKIAIETRCPFCGAINHIVVSETDYDRWISGGTCTECFSLSDG